ncbi:T9SS type A sorting domain-containing protein [Ichthyenterobacterium sp. W332]|uniref:T9SS type A sorting domain-containing protein n=1 Tax=Microcosmobacter mediterraneus TaxID=3075607 RepID=A0ABU2YJM6_9FLAO|nr:T9SS type A sorting domain-containing protein [Ichthyenterobacterium sp. W332]MDT0558015.1 T9SS type A sorting domain-containing protein [Ichthyenterobacterium sp. W332]
MKQVYIFIILILSFSNLNSQILIGQELFGTVAQERFGSRVDISADGQTIAVKKGVSLSSGDIGLKQIVLYSLVNNIWMQKGDAIDINITSVPSTLLAIPIALSDDGSTIVFSNPIDININRVQIFEFQGNTWIQKGNDILDGLNVPNNSIAINANGTTVAIGSTNTSSSGYAHVYRYESNSWVQIGSEISGEFNNDLLGWAVDLSDSGDIFAVSAIGHNNGSGFGQVQVFENQNNNWVKIGDDIDGEFPSNSGYDIKLSSDGNIVSIGIPLNSIPNSSVGGIKVFQNNSGNWEQIEDIINGSNPNFGFGLQLAMSNDGSIIISGDHRADENGSDSGKVSIFQFQNNEWVEVGVILGDFSSQFFGISTEISADGTVLVIGAEGIGPNLDEPGSVRVYDLSSLLVLSVNEFNTIPFKLYPNPAKDQFTIQLENSSDLKNVTIYNNLGQQVLSSKNYILDTSKLASGLYVVELETTKGKGSKNLIID